MARTEVDGVESDVGYGVFEREFFVIWALAHIWHLTTSGSNKCPGSCRMVFVAHGYDPRRAPLWLCHKVTADAADVSVFGANQIEIPRVRNVATIHLVRTQAVQPAAKERIALNSYVRRTHGAPCAWLLTAEPQRNLDQESLSVSILSAVT